jgi:hypothetical protein
MLDMYIMDYYIYTYMCERISIYTPSTYMLFNLNVSISNYYRPRAATTPNQFGTTASRWPLLYIFRFK